MSPLPLTPESFRAVAAKYPTGVVLVTTTADGFDHAMTASSFITVSLEPLLVLVSVEKETRFHDALIDPSSDGVGAKWGVSVLPEQASAVASWFAMKGRPLHGQFDRVDHYRGSATGSILLRAAIATMELETVETVAVGDHTLVIGAVQALEVVDDEDGTSVTGPLAYWARRYRQLAH